MADRPLAGAVALVTGASRGFGAAAAIALAGAGAHVVLTARTQGGLEQTDDAITAAGGTATLLPLDLHDGGMLDALGPSLFARFRRLDVLVHAAAALGRLTPAPHILPSDFADVVAVNFAAAWRLIRTTGPILLAAPSGRAVFVTDARAEAPRAYWGAYGATKAATDHLARTWAAEAETTRLRVNLFDPGPMRTRLRATSFPGEPANRWPAPGEAAAKLLPLCLPGETRNGERVGQAAVALG